MRTYVHFTAVAGAAFVSLACACGSSSGGGFNGGAEGDGGGNGGSSSSSSGAPGGSGGSGSGTFSTSGAGGMGTGTCKTGTYAGTFSCYFYNIFDAGLNYMPDSGAEYGPVMGTMSFLLTQDQTAGVGEGSTTDTAMGAFAASLAGIVQADATLQGTLNCSQGNFSGNLVNGVYGLGNGMGDAGPVSGGGAGNTFMGPLQSSYNGTSASFVNGRWSMTIPTLGECIGSWSATWSAPLAGSSGSSGGSSSGSPGGSTDASAD